MEVSMSGDEGSNINAWVAGLIAWAVPGLGHLYARRFVRALLLGGSVWLLFLLGAWLGGHLYGLFEAGAGFLSYVFGLFDLGAGFLYIISRAMDFAVLEQPEKPLSEYGNIFLMCAGLLNYLIALDAYDIVEGRRR